MTLQLMSHDSITTGRPLFPLPDLFVYNVSHVYDDRDILPCALISHIG
jgi:hypothetical protein